MSQMCFAGIKVRLNDVSHKESVISESYSFPHDAASGGERTAKKQEITRALVEIKRGTLVMVLSGNSATGKGHGLLRLVKYCECEASGLFEQRVCVGFIGDRDPECGWVVGDFRKERDRHRVPGILSFDKNQTHRALNHGVRNVWACQRMVLHRCDLSLGEIKIRPDFDSSRTAKQLQAKDLYLPIDRRAKQSLMLFRAGSASLIF